jgi:peptidoglycan L-alanyl-D-glutamate endopeptidase CwlK
MFKFSNSSKSKLSTCHTDLIILFGYVIRFYDCSVICGYRTKKDQEKAFNSGASKNHYPAKHNAKPSPAIDVAPYEKTHIDWSKTQSAHFAGFVMAIAAMLYDRGIITHQIRNGADWDRDNDVDDTTFWDACHFELVLKDGEVINYCPE